MTHREYEAKYNRLVERFDHKGAPHIRRVYWRLTERQAEKYGKVQLQSMRAALRRL